MSEVKAGQNQGGSCRELVLEQAGCRALLLGLIEHSPGRGKTPEAFQALQCCSSLPAQRGKGRAAAPLTPPQSPLSKEKTWPRQNEFEEHFLVLSQHQNAQMRFSQRVSFSCTRMFLDPFL